MRTLNNVAQTRVTRYKTLHLVLRILETTTLSRKQKRNMTLFVTRRDRQCQTKIKLDSEQQLVALVVCVLICLPALLLEAILFSFFWATLARLPHMLWLANADHCYPNIVVTHLALQEHCSKTGSRAGIESRDRKPSDCVSDLLLLNRRRWWPHAPEYQNLKSVVYARLCSTTLHGIG